MTFDIGLTLGIILMALILFATEKLRVDLIALIVLLLARSRAWFPRRMFFQVLPTQQ